MIVPWIYLCFNKEITPPSQTAGVQKGDSTVVTGLGESAIDKSKKQSHSLNSSRMGGGYHMGLGTSINKSGAGLLAQSGIDPNQFNNSALHESQMDVEMEYGYATDEDSIFHSFEQDIDKPISKPKKRVKITQEIKASQKEVKSVLKRFTEQTKSYEFLVRF